MLSSTAPSSTVIRITAGMKIEAESEPRPEATMSGTPSSESAQENRVAPLNVKKIMPLSRLVSVATCHSSRSPMRR